MNSVFVGAASGVVLSLAYVGWRRLRGCTGGHVYGEKEYQDWWRVVPFHSGGRVNVERKYVKHCQRSNCDGIEEGYEVTHNELYPETIAAAFDDALEVHYQCPKCSACVPSSERDTHWRMNGMNAGERTEQCPSCGEASFAVTWGRLPYSGVED